MSTAGEISGRKRVHGHNGRKEAITSRDGQDWYIEPAWTVDLLIKAEGFTGISWDPCAGSCTIPDRFVAAGLECKSSDIIDRGYYLTSRLDFTSILPRGWDVDNIVMNPPYREAERFVRIGIGIARQKVAALVQAKFPYSQARHALFTKHPPARIWFLSNRPSMPPGEELHAGRMKAKGGKLDYCWMVWDNARPNGPTIAGWLKRAAQ